LALSLRREGLLLGRKVKIEIRDNKPGRQRGAIGAAQGKGSEDFVVANRLRLVSRCRPSAAIGPVQGLGHCQTS
jgi:hypothetical protein